MTKAADLANKIANLFAKALGLTSSEQGQFRANIGTELMAGYRNKRINGALEIWTRGPAFTIPAGTGRYTADRLYVFNGTDQQVVITRGAFAPGASRGVPGEPRFFLRAFFANAPTTDGLYIFERIEDVRTLAGKQATGTWYVEPIPGQTAIAQYVDQFFGAGGSPGNIGGAAAIDANYQSGALRKVQALLDIPPLTGKTVTDGSWFSHVLRIKPRLSGNYDIARMSLVEGDARAEADPFTPLHLAEQYMLCQRYSQLVGAGMVGRWNSGVLAELYGSAIQTMRATPTPSFTQTTATMFRVGLESFAATGLSILGCTVYNSGIYLSVNKTGGGDPHAGEMAALMNDILFLDAEIY